MFEVFYNGTSYGEFEAATELMAIEACLRSFCYDGIEGAREITGQSVEEFLEHYLAVQVLFDVE